MEQLKFSIGPFELFASFLAGIPTLLAIYIFYDPKISSQSVHFLLNTSISALFLVAVISYLLGSLIAGVTHSYYKIARRVVFWLNPFWWETQLLRYSDSDSKKINRLKDDEFLQMSFEQRVVYFVDQQIGRQNKSDVCDLLLPFIRQNAISTEQKAEYLMANHIMYRNLSFGFLLLTIAFTRGAVLSGDLWGHLTKSAILVLVLSILALIRSVVLQQWRNREILLGFYHIRSKIYLTLDPNRGSL